MVEQRDDHRFFVGERYELISHNFREYHFTVAVFFGCIYIYINPSIAANTANKQSWIIVIAIAKDRSSSNVLLI
jgi:hypothetical protein